LSGTTPDENEQLKRCASGAASMDFSIFNNLFGILNGPADFELFRLLISSSISKVVVWKS
jgi:hypothetical protein